MAEPKKPATRPLPSLDELDTAPFWRGTREQQFKYQQCAACGSVVWHPRAHCTGCLHGQLQWQASAGVGEIYSYSVIRQSYHPFFRNQVPYVVAYVDLDEGPRFLTNMIGIENPDEDVHVGQRVQLVWEEDETLNIPLVQPASE